MAKTTLASKSMLAKMAVIVASTTTVAVQGAALQKAHDASLDAMNYTSEKVAKYKEDSSILPSEQAYYDFINKVNAEPGYSVDVVSTVNEEAIVQPVTNVITADNLAHGSPKTKVSNLKIVNSSIDVPESRPEINDDVITKFFGEMKKTVEDAKQRVENRKVQQVSVQSGEYKEEFETIQSSDDSSQEVIALSEENEPQLTLAEENVIENVEQAEENVENEHELRLAEENVENENELHLADEDNIEQEQEVELDLAEEQPENNQNGEEVEEIVSVDDEENIAIGVATSEQEQSNQNQNTSDVGDVEVTKTYTRVVKFVDSDNNELAQEQVQSFTVNGIKHSDGTYSWSKPANEIQFDRVEAPSIDGYELDMNNTYDLVASDSDESVTYTQYCTYHKESEFRNMKINVANTSGEIISTRDNVLMPLNKNVMIAFMSDSLPDDYVFEKLPIVNISNEMADESNNTITLVAKSINELSVQKSANISVHFVNDRNVEFEQANLPVKVRTYYNPVTEKTIVLDDVEITGDMINQLNINGIHYDSNDKVFDLRASDFNQNLQANIFIRSNQSSHSAHENEEYDAIITDSGQFKEENETIHSNNSGFKEETDGIISNGSNQNTEDKESVITEDSYVPVSKTFTRTVRFIDDEANGSQIKPEISQTVTINGEKNESTGIETFESGSFDEVQTNLEGYVNTNNVSVNKQVVDSNYKSEVIEVHYTHQRVRTPQQISIVERFVDENGQNLQSDKESTVQVTAQKDVITGQIEMSNEDISNGMNSYLQNQSPEQIANYNYSSSKVDAQNRTIVHNYSTVYGEEEETVVTPTTPTAPDEEFGEEEETITTPSKPTAPTTPTTPDEEFGEEEETITTPSKPTTPANPTNPTNPTNPSSGYKYTDWKQIDRNVIYQSTQKVLSEMPTQSSKMEYSKYQSINDILGGKGGDQFNLTGSKNILNAPLDYQNRVREVNRRYSQRMINNINKLRSDLNIRQLSLLDVSNQSLNNALINHSIDEYIADDHTTKTDKNMDIINKHAKWKAENFLTVDISSSNMYDISPEYIADDFFRLILKENDAFLANPLSIDAGHLKNILNDSTQYYGSLYVDNITTQKVPGGIFGNKEITRVKRSATDLFFK